MEVRHLSILLILLLMGCQKYTPEISFENDVEETIHLFINGKRVIYDASIEAFRFHVRADQLDGLLGEIEVDIDADIYFDDIQIQKNQPFLLIPHNYSSTVEIKVETKEEIITTPLVFSPVPIVDIQTKKKIKDEPKILGIIEVQNANKTGANRKYPIGIEHRGGSSQSFPKKSLGLDLLEERDFSEVQTDTLLTSAPSHSFILDALFVDPSRMRNTIAFKTWHTIYPSLPEIKFEPVVVLINDRFEGLYRLGIPLESALFPSTEASGSLFKAFSWEDGATRFETSPGRTPNKTQWDGWEQRYPDPEDDLRWKPLKELRQWVTQTDDHSFSQEMNSTIDVDNFIRWYILMNLFQLADNAGKNTFLWQMEDGQPFHIVPWDMEAGLGLSWDGKRTWTQGIQTNALFDRLLEVNPDQYTERLKSTWTYLRQNTLSKASLLSEIESEFDLLRQGNIIREENERWEIQIDFIEEEAYIKSWLDLRLEFLDEYF